MNPYDIIKRPLVTEKSVHIQNKLGSYTFEVNPKANKTQIKEAVETLFKVKVVAVNTMNCRGKYRKMRTRLPGMTSAWKKAVVRLVAGQKIEGV
ncbi:MAG: 50S ribosomal protein L23 [Planctomycetes bacterium]|nr:50S ribosomal protein L23 [Planctomycetota bacterium]